MAGIAETVSLDHIKRHYYGSQRHVNPTGIVPIGPFLDFSPPHNRGRFTEEKRRAVLRDGTPACCSLGGQRLL